MIRVITVRLFMLSLILTDSKITTFVSSIRSCREGFVGRQCEIGYANIEDVYIFR